MNDSSGWVALWRKAEFSDCFQDAELWRLWCYLLMNAKHSETDKGRMRNLEIGQLIISMPRLAKLFNCSVSTIQRRLKKLEDSFNQIVVKAGSYGSTVTIVNYKRYIPKRRRRGKPAGSSRKGNGKPAGRERVGSGKPAGRERVGSGKDAETEEELKHLSIEELKQDSPLAPQGESGVDEIEGRDTWEQSRQLGAVYRPETTPIPAILDTPEFLTHWQRWLKHIGAKSRVSQQTVESQLAKLARAGPAVAIAAIQESITAGWMKLVLENHTGQRERSQGKTHKLIINL